MTGELRARQAREASAYRCPAARPDLLISPARGLTCLPRLPAPASGEIGLSIPGEVRSRGGAEIAQFATGEEVAADSGCLACHRIGHAGNSGPGGPLTHVAARLSARAIERALVASPAPMPSFSRLPQAERRALLAFLTQLR